MLLKRKSPIKRLEFEFTYESQPIYYHVWLSDMSSPITTIVFLGTVQIGRLPAWIAYRCPPGVAVV